MIKKKNINSAIIGLGYVGLPLALQFAKRKKVIGFDLNQRRVKELNERFDLYLEFHKNE